LIAIIIVGIATFFNLFIIKHNIKHERYGNVVMDVGAIVVLNYFFGGTMSGMAVAMIASALFSTYLLATSEKKHADIT